MRPDLRRTRRRSHEATCDPMRPVRPEPHPCQWQARVEARRASGARHLTADRRAAAERQRRHRARERAGRVVLQVEVDEYAAFEAAAAAGLVDPDSDDRADLARAVAAVFAAWSATVMRDFTDP